MVVGQKKLKWVGALFVIAVSMFGFGFALVPIYNSLCKTLGINGKVVQSNQKYTENDRLVDKKRKITVQFVATNNGGVPWLFYPKIHQVVVHPGEIAKLAFYAENKTAQRMVVQAIPSVTPGIAAKYIKKTECFCFTRQVLNGHEAMDMPLLFHLDVDLPKSVQTITLAYTLFDVTNKHSS